MAAPMHNYSEIWGIVRSFTPELSNCAQCMNSNKGASEMSVKGTGPHYYGQGTRQGRIDFSWMSN